MSGLGEDSRPPIISPLNGSGTAETISALHSTNAASAATAVNDMPTDCPTPSHSKLPCTVSRILLLNARSISPAATGETKWKLPYLKNELLQDKDSAHTLFFGITESWLQEHFTDAQVKVECYECFRSDRSGRIGGGCILYVHEQLVVTADYSFRDRCNNLVVVYIASLHTIVAVLYRPSDAPDADFGKMLSELQNCIDVHSLDDKMPDVYLMGDFNIPEIAGKLA